MSDEKATAQLRYDFLMAAFAELRTSASTAVEYSQAALQIKNDHAPKEYFAAPYTASQTLLKLIEECLSLKLDHWTNEFLTMIHLEVGTLWSTIIGYPTWLLREAWGPIDEAQKPLLIQVKKSGEAVCECFNRVLDVRRTENYRMGISALCFAETDVTAIVEDFVSKMGKGGATQVETHNLDGLPKVWGNSDKISWVLLYMTAALSENFRQGKITLTAGCDGDMVAVTLENAGFALPAAAIEEFERVRSAGTLFACRRFDEALDLCIGQAIVEIHGGKFWVGSRAGGGSLVTFTLPAMKR